MKTIHRYELRAQDSQEVETHAGAVFLSVAVKPHETRVSLWAMVDTDEPKVSRTVRIVGTGHPLEPDIGSLASRYREPTFGFVGTACVDFGGHSALCWHVFVELEHV